MADELTQDEEAALLICAEGAWLAPIGRWETPVKELTRKGLLFRKDDVNYGITGAGRERAAALNGPETDARLKNIIDLSNQAGQAHAYIRAFTEPAAQLLVQAAQVSAKLTGDSEEYAAERWAQVILERAKQLLTMTPTGLPRP
jgi:hypothetical protein